MTPDELPDEFRHHMDEYKEELAEHVTTLGHLTNDTVMFKALAAIMDEQHRQASFNPAWPTLNHTALRVQLRRRY